MNCERVAKVKVKVKVGGDDKRLDDPILLCLQNYLMWSSTLLSWFSFWKTL